MGNISHLFIHTIHWNTTQHAFNDDMLSLQNAFTAFINQDASKGKISPYFDVEIALTRDQSDPLNIHHTLALQLLLTGILGSYFAGCEWHNNEAPDEDKTDDKEKKLLHIYQQEPYMLLKLKGTKILQVIAWIKCIYTEGNVRPQPAYIRFERVEEKEKE